MIVPPDRDTPGTRAVACAKPIVTPSRTRSCSSGRRCRPYRSAAPRASPNTISVVAINHRLRPEVWMASSNR